MRMLHNVADVQQLEIAAVCLLLALDSVMAELWHEEEAAGPSKKARRECKYQQEWQSHGIFRSCKGKNFAFCKTCNADINVSYGGICNVRKHLATAKYQQLVKAAGNRDQSALTAPRILRALMSGRSDAMACDQIHGSKQPSRSSKASRVNNSGVATVQLRLT